MSLTAKVRIATLSISVVALAILGIHTDPQKYFQAFSGIRWRWAVWVPILNLLNTWVEAIRLTVILSSVKKGAKVRNAFIALLLGILGNIILPLRMGDGARAYVLAKKEAINIWSSISAVMLDRIVDFAFFFAMVAITAFFYPLPPALEELSFLAAALLCATLAGMLLSTRFTRYIGERFGGKFARKLLENFGRMMVELSVVRNVGMILRVSILSALSWCLRMLMVWAMFEAFHLSLPAIAAAVTLILMNFGIAIANTPANIAGFEVSIVAALKLFDIDLEVALSYAIALHVIEAVPIIASALFVLWFGGYKSSEVFSMKSEQTGNVA